MRVSLAFAMVAILLGMRLTPAAACPPTLPPEDHEAVTVARDGVLSISLDRRDPTRIYAIEVATAAGAAVAGTTERIAGRLAWRPAAALDPGTAYQARLWAEPMVGGGREQLDDFTLAVEDVDTPPVAAPEVEIVDTRAYQLPADRLCCDPTLVTTCGGRAWRRCWAQTYTYPVQMTVRWNRVPAADRGAVVYRVIAADDVIVPEPHVLRDPALPGDLLLTTATFSSRQHLCVEIEALDLVRGTSERTQVCASDRPAVPAGLLEEPDITACESDIVDADSGAVVIEKPPAQIPDPDDDVAENRGCAAAPGGAGGAALIIALLALARRRRALAVVGASAAILLMRPAPADACTPPPPVPPRVSVTTTRDGVLSLALGTADAGWPAAVEVETGDGVAVTGAAERVDGRVVWRPAQALVPGETYRARLFADVGDEHWLRDEFAVVVLDADAPAAAAPVIELVEAVEVEVPAEQLCCDQDVTTCGTIWWGQCWAQAYDYPVDVTVRWTLTEEARRGVVLHSVILPPGATLRFPVSTQAEVRFPGRAARYCVDVEAFDVIRGTAARTQVCTDELREAERHAIQTPDIAACEGDIVDRETREVVLRKTGAGAGGCSAGGQGAALTTALAFAILCLVRRRR